MVVNPILALGAHWIVNSVVNPIPRPPSHQHSQHGSPATLERSRSVIGPGFGTPIECCCLDLGHVRAVLCQGVESRKRKRITPWPPCAGARPARRASALKAAARTYEVRQTM